MCNQHMINLASIINITMKLKHHGAEVWEVSKTTILSFAIEHTHIIRRCKEFLWTSALTTHRFGIRRICALLHSGQVWKAGGPSWLVFRIAKVLAPQNGDRITGDRIRS